MSSPLDNFADSYQWYADEGQVALGGDLLALWRQFDRAFLDIAALVSAEEYAFPVLLPAEALDRIDYFQSFPHLATFAINLEKSHANLEKFSAQSVDNGVLQLTETAPVKFVLTPSACYHCYRLLENQAQGRVRYLTTIAKCFRREDFYVPLERQWGFSMREIVCIGNEAEITAFTEIMRPAVESLLDRAGLVAVWQQASDPFFNPSRNAHHLWQQLAPVKQEAVFDERLALASINLHHDHFGKAFNLQRENAPLESACVAFGVERWVSAFIQTHGVDSRNWPDLG